MPRSKAGEATVRSAVDRAASAAAVVSPAAATSSALGTAEEKVTALSRHARASLLGPAGLGLVVFVSFTSSAVGHSFLQYATSGELESITKQPESTTEVALLAAWKIFGLAVGWYGNFDGYDLAALALLSSGPATYLTSAFYGIRPVTAGAYLGVDIVSSFLPFLLVRQLSGAHSAAPGVDNREIVADRGIQLLTSLLSGFILNVTLFLASMAFLPTVLVVHFNNIRTIIPAVDAAPASPSSLVLSLLFGIAARTFIFTPLLTTPRYEQEEKELAEFDPAAATLGETVVYNIWGFTSRTKVSIKRTGLAMLFTGLGTYFQCALGIQGVESVGAAVYASIFVVATAVTGLILQYVGNV